jgi:hypothetical protein
MSARRTFGIKLYLWDLLATPPAFLQVKKLTDLTPPSLNPDAPVDITNHDSESDVAAGSAVREFEPAGTKAWTDCKGTMIEDVDDPGQIKFRATPDSTQTFKIVKRDDPVPILIQAIVMDMTQGPNPLNGRGELSFTLKPSGVGVAYPTIVTQPAAAPSVLAGGDVTLSVVASGRPAVTYQWKKGAVDVEGATAADLQIVDAELADAGSYTCVVTNDYGEVTSEAAVLAVTEGS